MHTTYAAAKTHKASSFSTLKKIFVVAVLLLTTNVFSLHSKVVSSFFGDKQAIDYGNIHDSVRTNNNTIQVPSGATINSTAADMVPSIIAVLRGEMGNHLSGLAQAKGLQLMLKKEYNLDSKVLLHHRGDPQGLKWRNVKKVFQSCFPKLEKWNLQELEEDNTFRPTIRLQKDWLNNSNYKIALDQVNGQPLPLYQHITADSMQKALGTFAALWQDPSRPQPPGNKISIPFLMTTTLASNFLTDRYYDEIRELFSFNQSCCKLLPDPDETVFVSNYYAAFKIDEITHSFICSYPAFFLFI